MPGNPNIKSFSARTAVVLLAFILGMALSGLYPATASAADGPDLIVQSIALTPQDPALDDTVTITVTVKNRGNAPAGTSQVLCYVDNTILATNVMSSLGAGDMKTTAFTWTAQAGPHVFKAVADSGESVVETDETNNINTYTITTLAPDLIVQSITWSPEEPSRGDNIVFTVTIRNQGNSRARPNTIHLYIDGSSRGYQDIIALDPGGTTTKTFNWTAQSGQHAIKAFVDDINQVSENDESNNQLTSTFTTLPPDLVVDEIMWDPQNPSMNDVVTFTVTVTNQGTGRADSCNLAYFINNEFQSTLPVSSLEAETSVNITFNWTALSDAHEFKASIDYSRSVAESDESNNEKTANLLTAASDLTIESITWSPIDAGVGDTVTFTVTVKNQGGGKAGSSLTAVYISGSYKGCLNTGTIEADAKTTVTINWVATTGTHSVSAVADYDDTQPEIREDNNKLTISVPIIPPDLFISEISWTPENPAIGETVTFTITVENQGGGKADSFNVFYYIDDTVLASDLIANLASDAQEDTTCTWISQNGHHIFKAVVDSNQRINESNENNNTYSIAIAPNMPDLVIGTVTWTPSDMPTGEEVTFNIEVKNQGSLEAGPSRVNYYVDGVLAGYADIGQLGTAASVTKQLLWVATTGDHTIMIVADSGDQIFEIDEDNNQKIVTLPPPDLVIQDITWSPQDASIGDTIAFTSTFINQGSSQTQVAQATCYVDGLLVSTLDLPKIEPGDAVDRSFEWVAEPGLHTIQTIADINNRVTEADETNNDKEINFSTMTPDLLIEDISWLIDYPLISDDVTFTITIKNQGNDTSGASRLMYFIDEFSEVYKDIEPIPAGETAIVTFNVLLESGPHTITATIDPDDEVSELEETNNESVLEFSTDAPDLVINTITWEPLGAVPGDTVTFTAQVENRGRDPAVDPQLTLQINGSTAGSCDIAEIAAGATSSVDFTWTAEAGVHEITVLADMDELLAESNETNNTKSRTLTIEEPPAPVKAVKVSTDATTGDGLLGGTWWFILLIAALLGGGAFYAALKSFRKR